MPVDVSERKKEEIRELGDKNDEGNAWYMVTRHVT